MLFHSRWPAFARLAHILLARAGGTVVCVALLVLLGVLWAPSLAPSASLHPHLLEVSEARAEDFSLSLEQPTVAGQRLGTSSLWAHLESQTPNLPPAWQRRCQELHSIAVDIDSIGEQLPPQLHELKRKFLKAQRSVVYLLLDLAPTTMEASDNHALIVRLEEWEWFLIDPVRQVVLVEQELATYAGVLREVGEALARPRTADTTANAALLEVLPEVRSLHALLEARVAHLESIISPWLRPARTMQAQVRAALENTLRVQPQLWVNYYTLPQRLSRLSFESAPLDFQLMVEALTRGEVFLRPMVLSTLLAGFVLGCFILLFRTAQKVCTGPPQRAGHAPLWYVLYSALHGLSRQRKVALALGGVCVACIFVDALPQIHTHIPFVRVPMCVLLVAVAVWAKNAPHDPPLAALLLPVVGGFVLLESDASELWMMGGMIVLLLGSVVGMRMQRILKRQRKAALRAATAAVGGAQGQGAAHGDHHRQPVTPEAASLFYGVWAGTLVLGLFSLRWVLGAWRLCWWGRCSFAALPLWYS